MGSLGMDIEGRPSGHGDLDILDKKTKAKSKCCCYCTVLIFAAVVAAVFLLPTLLVLLLQVDAYYYVAIDSVSGLNPARGLSFNLSLGVASQSFGSKACVKSGMHVEVAYRDVQLAVAEAPWLCARPRKAAEQRVLAKATGVPVGDVLDRLTVDMRLGAAEFDVTLHIPAGSYGVAPAYGGDKWVSDCGPRRIGEATAWCDSTDQATSFD